MNEYIIPKEYSQDDRIGSYTIPQAIVLGAGTILGMFFFVVLPTLLGVPLFILIEILAVFLVFYKINDIPMYEFIPVYLIYASTPKLLMFRADNIKDEYIDEVEWFMFDEEQESLDIDISVLQEEVEKPKKLKVNKRNKSKTGVK